MSVSINKDSVKRIHFVLTDLKKGEIQGSYADHEYRRLASPFANLVPPFLLLLLLPYAFREGRWLGNWTWNLQSGLGRSRTCFRMGTDWFCAICSYTATFFHVLRKSDIRHFMLLFNNLPSLLGIFCPVQDHNICSYFCYFSYRIAISYCIVSQKIIVIDDNTSSMCLKYPNFLNYCLRTAEVRQNSQVNRETYLAFSHTTVFPKIRYIIAKTYRWSILIHKLVLK